MKGNDLIMLTKIDHMGIAVISVDEVNYSSSEFLT
jgi:hypothetical protein